MNEGTLAETARPSQFGAREGSNAACGSIDLGAAAIDDRPTPNEFRAFWDLGYPEVIPVVPPGAKLSERSHLSRTGTGKAPGIRGVDGLWRGMTNWQEHATSEADLAHWNAMGASVGLRRGKVLMLDIDAYDEATAGKIEEMALRRLGPAPMRVGRWPKRALLYRADDVIPNSKVTFVGADGQLGQVETPAQVVVAGNHPQTGKPYEWRRPVVHIDELSGITAAQFNEFMNACRAELPEAQRSDTAGGSRVDIDQDALRGDPDLVAAAVRLLPNTRETHPHYDDMVKVGQALHAALTDDVGLGNELWHEWSARWEGGDYDTDISERYWLSFRAPHSVGASWLFDQADRFTGGAFTAQRYFEVFDDPDPLFPADVPARATRHFEFVTIGDAARGALTASAKPLVKGLLDQGAMSVLFGESNVGKTFVAMDIAQHIASGLPWAGMRTAALPVVYVAAEGGGGAKKRAAALVKKYGDAGGRFRLLLSPVDLLRPDADLSPLLAALQALPEPPGLVVIDTLSRALAGGDENSSTDMGALIRNLDSVRDATAAHLMIVHHTGKDRARGARGHSLLRAAVDTEIEVADGVISVTKQRDLDKAWSSPFVLDVQCLGIDDEGAPITSCTVRLLHAAPALNTAPTDAERIVLDALEDIEEDSTTLGRGATTVEIVGHIVRTGGGTITKEAVRIRLRQLEAKRLVVRPTKGRWSLRAVDPPSTAPQNDNLSAPQSAGAVSRTVAGVFS